jgi:hypothetical protein
MLFTASIAVLSACGGVPLSPYTNERRNPHLEQDPSKTLTVKVAMEWYDGSKPTHGIRFPVGVYLLEGQDDQYWYLRSSVPLEFKEFKRGGKVETRNLAGGIMLGKYLFRAVPAAGYIDGDGSARVLVWKLGNEFVSREGKDWRKSF